MILDISALFSAENKEETREVHIDMDAFVSKLGKFPVQKSEPFELHLSNVENRRLLIQGETDVTIIIPCDRCLTEVPTDFHLAVDKDLLIEDGALAESEDALEHMEYLNGHLLDVDRLVYGELLLSWPMRTLCRADCRGICNKCGANLNLGDCGCDRTALDPRMAAFQDVFNKFKEV